MVKGLPSMIDPLRRSIATGTNLDSAALTDEERAAYASDIAWAARYVEEVPVADLVMPTMAVSDRMTLRRGNRIVDIRAMGPGHSQSDLIVHLPVEQIVIAGDLVIWPVPLAGVKSSIRGWSEALERIRALQPAVIVPGHGPVMRDDGYLRQLRDLFASVADQVDAVSGNGATLEAVRQKVDLAEWRARFAAGSQLKAFLFDYYVTGPGVAAAFREVAEARTR
jgi:glyoxylase-like metal-dependent hydrolase (beta-lactamase superfamily II)